jgi:hypothetical protein
MNLEFILAQVLRNVGVDCLYAVVLHFLPCGLNILFRNLYFMNLEFVLAQVCDNNHWHISQVQVIILNDHTMVPDNIVPLEQLLLVARFLL